MKSWYSWLCLTVCVFALSLVSGCADHDLSAGELDSKPGIGGAAGSGGADSGAGGTGGSDAGCTDGVHQDCECSDGADGTQTCEDGAWGACECTYYPDDDGDGYGDSTGTPVTDDQPPQGYVPNDDDCDDGNASSHPGAEEVCDGEDNDCDGQIDEGDVCGQERTWYEDADNDGRGNPNRTIVAVVQPDGYVANSDDCDDTRADVYKGAPEKCDGVDNDCDGQIDEGGVCNDCTPGTSETCSCPNGTSGTRHCDASGHWGTCQGCTVCQPGNSESCTCPNGTSGERFCDASGNWTSCTNCSGVCSPGASESCTCSNGTSGTRYCDQYGQWGTCGNCSGVCQPGTSQPCTCSNGTSGTQYCDASGNWGTCTNCTGVCTPGTSQSCTCSNGTSGTRYCDASGNWGVCGYCVGECSPGTARSCTCTNGSSGTQYCDANGYWGDCGSCSGVCTPGASQPCTCTDGSTGTQFCDQNSQWGACGGCGSTGNTVTVKLTYTGSPWSEFPLEIWAWWNGKDTGTLPNCHVSNGTSISCTFEAPSGATNFKFQVDLGNDRYWGDTSGLYPAPCIPASELASYHGTCVEVARSGRSMGKVCLEIEGTPVEFTLRSNGIDDPNDNGAYCGASTVPYMNGWVTQLPY